MKCDHKWKYSYDKKEDIFIMECKKCGKTYEGEVTSWFLVKYSSKSKRRKK